MSCNKSIIVSKEAKKEGNSDSWTRSNLARNETNLIHLQNWSASARWHHLDARRYHSFEHLSRKELTRETLHSSPVSDELTKREVGFKLRTGASAQAGRNSKYKLGARSFTWPRVSHRSFLQKTQFSTSKLPKFTTAWAYLTRMLTWLQSVLTIRRFRLRQGVIRNSS